jgi:sulfite exporter TauE/SafE
MDLLTAFILGLVGSLHCAGMCGPLALALPHPGGSATRFFASRFAYNLGRVVTYIFIGICFGSLGRSLVLAGLQRWTSITLGALLLLALIFSRKLRLLTPLSLLVERLKQHMSALLRRRSLYAVLILGLLNGLLPCGLVYVAATGAAATGSILGGAGYMAAFGAGTVPIMLTISLSTSLVPIAFRLKLRQAIPISAFLLASLLILRGMNLGIPFISPHLAIDGTCCSH